jgi:hypothetical protein
MSEDYDEGKKKFLDLVKSIDGAVEVVIPVTPSRGNFLISLTKGKVRKFITVNEDDIVELPDDEDIVKKIAGDLKTAIAEFSVT